MGITNRTVPLAFAVVLMLLAGCGKLDAPGAWDGDVKTRGEIGAGLGWSDVSAQDLAILLPRDEGEGIKATMRTASGARLLSQDWLDIVSDAYLSTDVDSAFEDENRQEEWMVMAIRVAPCSPMGHRPGHEAQHFCWPELRLVWQPVLYDFAPPWATVPFLAYSDDRAIHALYRVYADGARAESDAVMREMTDAIKAGVGITDDLNTRFNRLRDAAVDNILRQVVALREDGMTAEAYKRLDIRVETLGEYENRAGFYKRLETMLAVYAEPTRLHALTSFSLPEGRNPAITDIWVFLAFEGLDGFLIQKSIEVVSPRSGQVLVELGAAETVPAAGADQRVLDVIEADSARGNELADQVLTTRHDRERLSDKINDPNQTLIPNTSCATCHSFNDLTFNFHNLSYFEELDLTVAKRVRNDVIYDLKWLKDGSN